jgi:hypothetical protein
MATESWARRRLPDALGVVGAVGGFVFSVAVLVPWLNNQLSGSGQVLAVLLLFWVPPIVFGGLPAVIAERAGRRRR